MTSRSAALTRAHLADALTASRVPLGFVLVPVIAGDHWLGAGILLSIAWWTDFFDGRVAKSTTGTRLGAWDGYADAMVGAGVLVGVLAGGHVPVLPFAAAGLVFGVVLMATGNFAYGMLLQATGYGPLLFLFAAKSAPALVVAVATIVVIAIADRGRFVGYVLPTFFEGVRLRR